MIVKLTEENGQTVFISSENIVRFSRDGEITSIKMTDGQWVHVKDTPEYIGSVINAWGK